MFIHRTNYDDDNDDDDEDVEEEAHDDGNDKKYCCISGNRGRGTTWGGRERGHMRVKAKRRPTLIFVVDIVRGENFSNVEKF